MSRAIRAAILAASTFILAGCEQLDFLLEIFTPVDMSADPDPVIQASGVSHQATQSAEEAERTVHEVLNGEKPPEELDDLRALRPGDSKIANYVFWLAILDGNARVATEATVAARSLHRATYGEDDLGRLDRLWIEENLDVVSDILNSQDPGEGDRAIRYERLRRRYCVTLSDYDRTYRDTFEGAAFIALANTEPCAPA